MPKCSLKKLTTGGYGAYVGLTLMYQSSTPSGCAPLLKTKKAPMGRLLRVLTGRYSAGVGESVFAGSAFGASGFTASTGFSGCPLSASRGNVS